MVSPKTNMEDADDSNSGTEKLINDVGKQLPPLVPPEKAAKKPPIWSWKGLKALTNVRNRKFNCCFSVVVHSIDGLPPIFDDECVVVHWKRRDTHHMTHPVRVSQGVAQIEHQLTHSCSVHGGQNGPHNMLKYEAKHFLLSVSLYNAADLNLGKHRVDMTRMLPLTFGELEEESSGKWATTFSLSGKARGATLNVSFGYVMMINGKSNSVPESPRVKQASPFEASCIRRVGSLPANLSMLNQPDIKEDLFPTKISESVNVLYQKLDKEMSDRVVENDHVCSENKLDFGLHEPTVVDKELEENVLQVDIPPVEEEMITQKDEQDMCSKESLMKEIETVLSQITDLGNEDENDGLDKQDSSSHIMSRGYEESTVSLDDVNDFLDMLGLEHTNSKTEPESPREWLLNQFNKDGLGIKNDPEIPLFSPWEDISNDIHTHEVFRAMPDLEMCRWGLNEECKSNGLAVSPSLFADDESLGMQLSNPAALRNENQKPLEEKEVNEDKNVCEEEVTIKIAQVCVRSVKVESGKKKKLWGKAGQQRVGSRWLIANGMGKKKKHPLMKAKVVGK